MKVLTLIFIFGFASCSEIARKPAQYSEANLSELFNNSRQVAILRATNIDREEIYPKLSLAYGGSSQDESVRLRHVRYTVFWRTFMKENEGFVPIPKFLDNFMSYDPGITFNRQRYPYLKEKYASELVDHRRQKLSDTDIAKVQSLLFIATLEKNQTDMLKWAKLGHISSLDSPYWQNYIDEWLWFSDNTVKAIHLLETAELFTTETRKIEPQIISGQYPLNN